jgi:hypothetical protein
MLPPEGLTAFLKLHQTEINSRYIIYLHNAYQTTETTSKIRSTLYND